MQGPTFDFIYKLYLHMVSSYTRNLKSYNEVSQIHCVLTVWISSVAYLE
jgi:hypothetical protein